MRGRTAGFLGWMMGLRHEVYGKAERDQRIAIELLEEALEYPVVNPVATFMHRITLVQHYLGRAAAYLQVAIGTPQSMMALLNDGVAPQAKSDVDRAVELARAATTADQPPADWQTVAASMRELAEATHTPSPEPFTRSWTRRSVSAVRSMVLSSRPVRCLRVDLQATVADALRPEQGRVAFVGAIVPWSADRIFTRYGSAREVVELARRTPHPITRRVVFVANPRGDREHAGLEAMVLRRMFHPNSAGLGRLIERADGAGTSADV